MTRWHGQRLALAILVAVSSAVPIVGAQPPAGARAGSVPIVAVSGCLAEPSPGHWMLTSATEPTPSIANAPPAGQPVTGPTTGKHEFTLIGVSEFDLPAHKGHTMLVKALLIKSTPTMRLNVTSVTMISQACPPPPK
ncbi:MAG: hypothetical protein ACT4QD_20535 [Acidobacteriota bacterium]